MPIPYLTLVDPRAAMALYERALGATPGRVMDGPDGSVMHAEMTLGDATLMLSGEFAGFASAPSGRSPVNFMLYVDDVDAAHDRAASHGMQSSQAPEDQFWGDRIAKLDDGHGYEWTLAQRIETVDDEELARRITAYAKRMSGT